VDNIAKQELKIINNDIPTIKLSVESNVVNNEVIYDFKLRKGITKSKNATFLLKSLGVID